MAFCFFLIGTFSAPNGLNAEKKSRNKIQHRDSNAAVFKGENASVLLVTRKRESCNVQPGATSPEQSQGRYGGFIDELCSDILFRKKKKGRSSFLDGKF